MSHRLILSSEPETTQLSLSNGSSVTLAEEDAHYLQHVLRLKKGAQISVIDPVRQILAEATIDEIGQQVKVTINSVSVVSEPCSPISDLMYPLTKGDTIQLVLEKGCELGVERFILWQAHRSVVRVADAKEQAKKLARWIKIIRAACQQSGKIRLPEIVFAENLDHALNIAPVSNNKPQLLQCSLNANAKPLATLISHQATTQVVIGPEGDFSAEEESSLRLKNATLASLGPYRLRAETAAICAISIIIGVSGFPQTRHTR